MAGGEVAMGCVPLTVHLHQQLVQSALLFIMTIRTLTACETSHVHACTHMYPTCTHMYKYTCTHMYSTCNLHVHKCISHVLHMYSTHTHNMHVRTCETFQWRQSHQCTEYRGHGYEPACRGREPWLTPPLQRSPQNQCHS